MNKIAFLIPTTSKNREWKTFNDSYLCQILLPSINLQQDITLYIGYDDDDDLFKKSKNRISKYENIKFKWFSFNGYKGNPCAIWSKLADYAIVDNFEYFFVLGDDIALDKRHEWMGVFLKALKKNNNIGYSAGWSNNDDIPTQFLLHKNHIDIFGWVYPPQIKNWQCDDFIYHLYGDKYGNWLRQYKHLNCGGQPRYQPDNCITLREILVKKNRKVLKSYLDK
tara:strand:- start:2035 stop:2703 length:669 start_codon:yes stop_codon:yes gene_type:complete